MNLLLQCSAGKLRGKSQMLRGRKRYLDFKGGNHVLTFWSVYGYGFFQYLIIIIV